MNIPSVFSIYKAAARNPACVKHQTLRALALVQGIRHALNVLARHGDAGLVSRAWRQGTLKDPWELLEGNGLGYHHIGKLS